MFCLSPELDFAAAAAADTLRPLCRRGSRSEIRIGHDDDDGAGDDDDDNDDKDDNDDEGDDCVVARDTAADRSAILKLSKS